MRIPPWVCPKCSEEVDTSFARDGHLDECLPPWHRDDED